MPQKQKAFRQYHLADAVLKQRADAIHTNVKRDISAFLPRSVDLATLSNFKTMISAFADMPSDEEILGALSVATADKDTAADSLRTLLRTVRTMAQNKWGTDDAHYRTFYFDDLDALSDEELLRAGKRVVRVASAQLAMLAPEGLTLAVISDLSARCNTFDNAIDSKEAAVNERDIRTQERITKGNAVYKEMQRLCNTGKDIFVTTDEAKYNDYIIYDTPSGYASGGSEEELSAA